MTGKVGGSTTELRAFREKIPENFPERQNDGVTDHRDIPSSCSIFSSGTPFVSGTMSFTQMSYSTIMKVKNPKTALGWNHSTMVGKNNVSSTAKIQ